MGRKNSQETQDNPLLAIGGVIGILAVFYFVFAYSPAVLEWQAVWIKNQTSVYHAIYPAYMAEEFNWLTKFKDLLKQPGKAKRLQIQKARELLAENTKKTKAISFGIAAFIIVLVAAALLAAEIKKRKALYSRNENISAPKTSGLAGYIEFVSRHLPQEKLDWLKADPSPDRITAVFEFIRLKKNIPNAIPARLFPPFSETRLKLLEVGKKNLFDRDAILNLNENQEEKNG